MCTAITMQTLQNDRFLARNMDFTHDIQSEMLVMPRGASWTNIVNNQRMEGRYAFIGIGQPLGDILAFFDGVNEQGFAGAALYFAGYASYDTYDAKGTGKPVASYDFLRLMLENCGSIAELRALVGKVSIIGMKDPLTETIAPLHWIAADASGACVVIEQTAKGVAIFDNPLGVFANAPDFPWHMTNLNNYIEVSSKQTEQALWGTTRLTAFGQSGGTASLPGGFTSPARFVRAAFLKTHADTPKTPAGGVTTCLNVLENVSIPRGVVLTSRASTDYTKYTACINLRAGEYYFRTQDNPQVFTASLRAGLASGGEMFSFGKLDSMPLSFPSMISENAPQPNAATNTMPRAGAQRHPNSRQRSGQIR